LQGGSQRAFRVAHEYESRSKHNSEVSFKPVMSIGNVSSMFDGMSKNRNKQRSRHYSASKSSRGWQKKSLKGVFIGNALKGQSSVEKLQQPTEIRGTQIT
jgi:hypothetical protein